MRQEIKAKYKISIHALREEGDGHAAGDQGKVQDFYPRPPRRGRLWSACPLTVQSSFLSTPSAKRATYGMDRAERHRDISIHALREEGDALPTLSTAWMEQFLSTPSARRATLLGRGLDAIHGNFYPRPPRGGRRPCGRRSRQSTRFLSTPSARRATLSRPSSTTTCGFLSTPSARRATAVSVLRTAAAYNFYPRPPRGGRRQRRCRTSLHG